MKRLLNNYFLKKSYLTLKSILTIYFIHHVDPQRLDPQTLIQPFKPPRTFLQVETYTKPTELT